MRQTFFIRRNMTRTILIFPEFDNIEVIDRMRDRYDPLAHLIRPHITLVFPFESSVSNEALAQILDRTLEGIHPFTLCIRGVSKRVDMFGNALMLDVTEGKDILCRIHDGFYARDFREFDKGIPYDPHITVGNFTTPEALDAAFETIRDLPDVFSTIIRRVSVEMIGPNDESIIVLERELT